MIPDRKRSPNWTANVPDQKIRNGMDGDMVWIGKWCEWDYYAWKQKGSSAAY